MPIDAGNAVFFQYAPYAYRNDWSTKVPDAHLTSIRRQKSVTFGRFSMIFRVFQ